MQNSTAKCWEVNLKEGSEFHYTFTRPDKDENVQGVNVQLRFYYEEYADGWYASKVYPLSADETSNSASSLWLLLLLLVIPVLLGIGLIVFFLIRKRANRKRSTVLSTSRSSVSTVGTN
ncbi:hypothetical protein Ciccas_010911 [Cichlidogyrus casuarinus]|uniref:Uncharacterized protein n=1 Tax=Cichlidogyrus casuarinus TaxID=1844966 RepID=A0ABD2PTK9_9PLAT